MKQSVELFTVSQILLVIKLDSSQLACPILVTGYLWFPPPVWGYNYVHLSLELLLCTDLGYQSLEAMGSASHVD